MSKRQAVTAETLREWGYYEQADGTWSKQPGAAGADVGGLDAQKHGQPARALDQAKPKKRRGKVRRAPGVGGSIRYVVTLIAHVQTAMDYSDNLPNSLKPVQDEIAELLGVDDGDGSVRWQYGQVETRGETGVSVKIESNQQR
ncbi:MAG: hypothetical protein Q7Q73_02605 [Verrucomicrobiota bacterium JB024]|nr:hypothetical protein [Verrucomicrobiota bacterium JB024]